MELIKIRDVVVACGGQFVGDESLLDRSIDNIYIDSRAVIDGSLFIPIKGEVYDGHKFIDSAFEKGCICTLSEKQLNSCNYILVESTFQALKDIAEYYKSLFDIKTIAITGSVGKTTSKEMIATVLSQKFHVLKNKGNLNNEFGVPLTLFNLDKSYEVAVIEMGMNNFGEIDRLSKVARPDICVIVNIGEAHIGKLGSREGIFNAKTEIFNYMKKDGQVFLNGDDDMLVSLNESDLNPVFFGMESYNHVSLKEVIKADIKESVIVANVKGEEIQVIIPVPGEYMISSTLCAIVIGKEMGLTNAEIQKGVASYKPAKMRKDIIETEKITIISDCYNACEDSVLTGLDVLNLADGRKVAILGDILEAGDHGERVHFRMGEKIADKNIDVVICCGELSKYTYDGLKANVENSTFYFEDKEKMHNELSDIIKVGDTVYVKASRGCAFEESIEILKGI